MTRLGRDRRGRQLTKEQLELVRERANALKKRTRRKPTRAEYLQIVLVIAIILGIILIAITLMKL